MKSFVRSFIVIIFFLLHRSLMDITASLNASSNNGWLQADYGETVIRQLAEFIKVINKCLLPTIKAI